MTLMWFDLLKIFLGGTVGALLSWIIMLIRERNRFSVQVMELFLEDKQNWNKERDKLEARVDHLTRELDKVKDKYVELALRQTE